MNFHREKLVQIVKSRIFIVYTSKWKSKVQIGITSNVWHNREFSSVVVAFINDATMINKKKRSVHYTQLDGDVAGSPATARRSVIPEEEVAGDVANSGSPVKPDIPSNVPQIHIDEIKKEK